MLLSSSSFVVRRRKSHPWTTYACLDDLRTRFLSHIESNRNGPQISLGAVGIERAPSGVEKRVIKPQYNTHKSLDFSTCDMDSCEEWDLIQIKNFHMYILSR